MAFLENQVKKEVVAAKRIWGRYLIIVTIFWGVMGFVLLASSAWPLGLIFIGGAGYIFYRRKKKTSHGDLNV